LASPLGHALAGLLLHAASARSRGELVDGSRACALAALAGAADLDLLGRFFLGRSVHHGPTHSVGFALAIGLAVWLWGRGRRWPEAGRAGLLAGAAWALHALVDFVSCDTTPPLGPMVLWPFSARYWISPVTLFLDTSRTLSWVAVQKNALAMAWESAVLAPVLFGVWRFQLRRLR
jgi:membrane-bound metal-dependent hydrolase YbcI (DUF457 family)